MRVISRCYLCAVYIFVFLQVALALDAPEQKLAAPKPAAQETLPAGEQKPASDLPQAASDKVSLDLKGVDINELLKMLSTKSGITIVTTP